MSSRMSSRNKSQSQNSPGVFGYIIDPYDGQEPGGPPLLDNNEAGILQTFFDNPNNIAPGFMSMTNVTTLNSGTFGLDESSFGWAIDTPAHVSGNTSNVGHFARAPGQGEEMFPGNASMQDQLSAHTAVRSNLPEEVYAAARLLQNRQTPDQYQYPSIPHSSAGPYEFSANAPLQSHNQPMSMSFTNPSEAAGPAPADVPAEASSGASGGTPLEFGTDDQFRQAAYQGPPREAVDKTLRDSVQRFWKVLPTEAKRDSQKPSSMRAKKQKTRSKSPEGESGDDSEASESGGTQGESPRKRKVKEGDESGSTKGGKRRQSTSRSKSSAKAAGSSSVKKGHRETASAGRAQRENLSEEQKRSNHIQSEQKRRNLIKQGFEDLNRMVPELRSGGLSKSNMLVEAAKFLKKLQIDNEAFRAELG